MATVVKENPPDNAGDIRDVGLIPGLRRSPGEGDGNPVQYSCLGKPWTEECQSDTFPDRKRDSRATISATKGLLLHTLKRRK